MGRVDLTAGELWAVERCAEAAQAVTTRARQAQQQLDAAMAEGQQVRAQWEALLSAMAKDKAEVIPLHAAVRDGALVWEDRKEQGEG